MRLYLFSDLHCDALAAQRVVEMAQDADVVIGAGDFATARRNLETTLEVLKQISRPTIVVPGNSESPDELRAACRDWPSAHVLHGDGVTIDGQQFFGIGGAVPETPFGPWSFDLSEDAARQLLAPCPSNAILVSHSPPKGYVDRSSSGQSLGSLAVLEAIRRVRSPLVVCGHIHESGGKRANCEGSLIINAGPDGAVFQLNRQN